jgi:hypothetical protein
VLFEDCVEVPLGILSLEDFRCWARCEKFPEKARIDDIDGRIEVNVSLEDVFCHGTVKSEIAGVPHGEVERPKQGPLLIHSSRGSCPEAELSTEPDIVFVSRAALDAGRVRLLPQGGGQPGRYVGIEGPPGLVGEIVSDISVTSDAKNVGRQNGQARVGNRGANPRKVGHEGSATARRSYRGGDSSWQIPLRIRILTVRRRTWSRKQSRSIG